MLWATTFWHLDAPRGRALPQLAYAAAALIFTVSVSPLNHLATQLIVAGHRVSDRAKCVHNLFAVQMSSIEIN